MNENVCLWLEPSHIGIGLGGYALVDGGGGAGSTSIVDSVDGAGIVGSLVGVGSFGSVANVDIDRRPSRGRSPNSSCGGRGSRALRLRLGY